MNRDQGLFFAGVGLVCGAVGYFTGVLVTDGRLRKEYEESAKAYRNAMERVVEFDDHTPVETEAALTVNEVHVHLDNAKPLDNDNLFDAAKNAYMPPEKNPYHTAVTATETPVDIFVSGEPNAYGISYIEDEEYYEDDGRAKYSVNIVMDAHNPTFFMDGLMIDDWADRLGASIVKDFLDRIPPGIDPVLYVRNHRTEEDYEITAERP